MKSIASSKYIEKAAEAQTSSGSIQDTLIRKILGFDGYERIVTNLLARRGVMVNGLERDDLQVLNERFYKRVLTKGSLGLGESYIKGWWDCASLDTLLTTLLKNDPRSELKTPWSIFWEQLVGALTNVQHWRPYDIGAQHYDLGNEFYRAMLGDLLVYSCGYWKNASTLEAAQEAKMDLICRKLHLKPGQQILDIGCGWGALVKYAAKNYGVSAVGITISREQEAYSKENCAGLPVEIRYENYAETEGTFDHIVSVGMFEHVGCKNYKHFMHKVKRLLKDEGLFLLHTIGTLRSQGCFDPWLNKYIFPNAFIPSLKQISESAEGVWVLEDLQNFGADYDRTLMSWWRNFEMAWPRFKFVYGDHFYRMWRYYLLMCAASFRVRRNQLWQFVFSKRGVENGYKSVR